MNPKNDASRGTVVERHSGPVVSTYSCWWPNSPSALSSSAWPKPPPQKKGVNADAAFILGCRGPGARPTAPSPTPRAAAGDAVTAVITTITTNTYIAMLCTSTGSRRTCVVVVVVVVVGWWSREEWAKRGKGQ